MVFVIRSLTTLDFAAARTNCNMYEVAAPTAIFRALSPRTDRGKKALEQMLLDKDGDVNWSKLVALSAQANTAAEQGESGAAASTADEHAKDAINRLMNDLVDSSAGSALRRLALKAVRKVCCLRRAFAHSSSRSLEHLSPARWQTFPSELSSPPRSPCSRRAQRRRPRESWRARSTKDPSVPRATPKWTVDDDASPSLLLRSKLSAPSGVFGFLSIVGLLAWAALAGALDALRARFAPPRPPTARADDDAFPPLAPRNPVRIASHRIASHFNQTTHFFLSSLPCTLARRASPRPVPKPTLTPGSAPSTPRARLAHHDPRRRPQRPIAPGVFIRCVPRAARRAARAPRRDSRRRGTPIDAFDFRSARRPRRDSRRDATTHGRRRDAAARGIVAGRLADAARNFVRKSRGLACDGYIVYDIQEEAGRTPDARPFPFRKLDDPGAFAAALRKASGGTESVVYKCVAETKSEERISDRGSTSDARDERV